MTSPDSMLHAKPDLDSVTKDIQKLHTGIMADDLAALHKAIQIGGLLEQARPAKKHEKSYQAWIRKSFYFSTRTAGDYVRLFHGRDAIERHERENPGAGLSIRGALKFLKCPEQPPAPPAPVAITDRPVEIEVEAEAVDQHDEEARLADRALLLVEANIGFVDELVSLIRAAKRTGKEVAYQKLGAFDSGQDLNRHFAKILGIPRKRAA
jgi:hypothetical protein